MKFARYALSAGAAVLLATAADPAAAQKSKDTLRVAGLQPVRVVDAVFDPNPQTNLLDRMVFDTLVYYDVEARKVVPLLAESYTRVDPLTIEYKLRKGLKFHNGMPVTADDVVYTFDFVKDPKVNFRFKGTRYGVYSKAVKVDDHTVRISTKATYAPFESRIMSLPIFPKAVHSKLEDRSKFGLKPIGTGPYMATQVDATAGVVLEKNPNFKLAAKGSKSPAKIGRIEFKTIANKQTQIARLIAGEQDMVYQISKDQAENLAKMPNLQVTIGSTIQFIYFMVDAADRSKIGIFKDKRVREALMHAIDRRGLAKALVPEPVASEPLQISMCHEWHTGCKATKSPPAYDPARAKALLKEAGVDPNFSLALTTWGPSRPTAEAVAGQLRKLGIKATVDNNAIGGFVKKRAQGKVQAFVSLWDNGGGQADVVSTSGFFYLPGSRNYNGDKQLAAWHKQGQTELDLAKREAIYQKLFDRVTEERYSMPIVPIASAVAHTKEVKLPTCCHRKPEGFLFNLIEWN